MPFSLKEGQKMTSPVEPTEPVGPASDATSDDRLWALLGYILTPVVPIILMLMEDKKSRPFIKAHNAQALALGVVQVVCWALSFTCVTMILSLLLFVGQIYWGIQAYNGKYVTIPFLTDFVKKQGWA
jgi:uncharacterized membrane protein